MLDEGFNRHVAAIYVKDFTENIDAESGIYSHAKKQERNKPPLQIKSVGKPRNKHLLSGEWC
jgi:hypothetical protein